MVPRRDARIVEAFHAAEPPLTPSLSPTGGEGARTAGEGERWFRVPMRDRKAMEADLGTFAAFNTVAALVTPVAGN